MYDSASKISLRVKPRLVGGLDWEARDLADKFHISPAVAMELIKKYGSNSELLEAEAAKIG